MPPLLDRMTGRWGLITGSLAGIGDSPMSVVYDEDIDSELDTGLFRIPMEKISFPDNARSRMGPASFDDASFLLSGTDTAITVSSRSNQLLLPILRFGKESLRRVEDI